VLVAAHLATKGSLAPNSAPKGFEILMPALGKLSKYGSVTIVAGKRRRQSRQPQTR